MDNQQPPVEAVRLTEESRQCSYLETETASLEYRLFPSLSPAEVEFLLERGWRRFGIQFFRPACEQCAKCVPIRVDVDRFKPSRSQRKALHRNSHISVSVHSPAVSTQHLELYNRWHTDMSERRGWNEQESTAEEYCKSFLSGQFSSLHEIRYLHGDHLVGIGLVDVLPNSLSSAYFYHDPHWRESSPGTFSLLCEIDLARRLHLKHLYLGYWIEGCTSMAYKNRFHPSETLQGYPEDLEKPDWGWQSS